MTCVATTCPVVPTSSIHIDEYALRRIEFRVRRLARVFGLNDEHADDLRQDMVVELLKALPRFDPFRCSQRTFTCRILNRTFKSMARTLVARLRHRAMNPGFLGEFEPVCNNPARGELSEEDLADVCMDFEHIIPSMPDRLRRVAETLMVRGCPADAARALGVHRANILRAMRDIRAIFEAAGYGDEEILPATATNCPHAQK